MMPVVPCPVTFENFTLSDCGGVSGGSPVAVLMGVIFVQQAPEKTCVLSTVTVLSAAVSLAGTVSTCTVGKVRGSTVGLLLTLPGTAGVTEKFSVADAPLASVCGGQVTVACPPTNALNTQPEVLVPELTEVAG